MTPCHPTQLQRELWYRHAGGTALNRHQSTQRLLANGDPDGEAELTMAEVYGEFYVDTTTGRQQVPQYDAWFKWTKFGINIASAVLAVGAFIYQPKTWWLSASMAVVYL